eukprot:4565476-Pyramimonas_sp.AAC.1
MGVEGPVGQLTRVTLSLFSACPRIRTRACPRHSTCAIVKYSDVNVRQAKDLSPSKHVPNAASERALDRDGHAHRSSQPKEASRDRSQLAGLLNPGEDAVG